MPRVWPKHFPGSDSIAWIERSVYKHIDGEYHTYVCYVHWTKRTQCSVYLRMLTKYLGSRFRGLVGYYLLTCHLVSHKNFPFGSAWTKTWAWTQAYMLCHGRFSQYLRENGFNIIPLSAQDQLEYGCNVLNLGNSNIVRYTIFHRD
jgi:hypothetical protein